jgi:hemerythrin
MVVALMLATIALSLLPQFSHIAPWLLASALLMMPFLRQKHIKQIKWSEEYSIGIDYIDNDHKKLLHLLNQFSIAFDYAQCEEFERDALTELVSYTRYHFRREEKLMEDYNYPQLAEHKEEHQAMIDTVEGYVKIYNKEGHNSLKQVTNLLEFWLINHIKESDKQYRDYLQTLGADELDVT